MAGRAPKASHLRVIAEVLGHANTQLAADTYGHLADQMTGSALSLDHKRRDDERRLRVLDELTREAEDLGLHNEAG